ncbi:MAG: translation initiation factor IF-6 [Candidatus Thermoplasmatota archaeon]|nr:translation initiation factor IF-6 [Candidatus Thermoplasmatota archaeon]
MLRKVDFSGNPYLGVFAATNDGAVIASPSVPAKALRRVEDALGVRAIRMNIGGSTLVGSLLALNSQAILLTSFVRDEEIAQLEGFQAYVLEHRLNAVGNNVLVNDHGALCHPGYSKRARHEMEDVFGVQVQPATLGGQRTVGSAGVATNRGAICHPHATEEELVLLEEVLKVKPVIATANYGTPQLGACVVANDGGAITGTPTTPIELGRIEEGLRLY